MQPITGNFDFGNLRVICLDDYVHSKRSPWACEIKGHLLVVVFELVKSSLKNIIRNSGESEDPKLMPIVVCTQTSRYNFQMYDGRPQPNGTKSHLFNQGTSGMYQRSCKVVYITNQISHVSGSNYSYWHIWFDERIQMLSYKCVNTCK